MWEWPICSRRRRKENRRCACSIPTGNRQSQWLCHEMIKAKSNSSFNNRRTTSIAIVSVFSHRLTFNTHFCALEVIKDQWSLISDQQSWPFLTNCNWMLCEIFHLNCKPITFFIWSACSCVSYIYSPLAFIVSFLLFWIEFICVCKKFSSVDFIRQAQCKEMVGDLLPLCCCCSMLLSRLCDNWHCATLSNPKMQQISLKYVVRGQATANDRQ